MQATSIHIKPCKIGSAEEHNHRLKALDYVRADLTKFNENWTDGISLSQHLENIKRLTKEKTGRKMQAKATPIREGVIVVKETTTLADLKRFTQECEKRWGIRALQISNHKDEGHMRDKEWKPNYHAHVIFDFTDRTTGKSIKLSRQDMAQMQTLLADTLQMERGKSSDLKHLDAIQYKNEQEKKRSKEISEEIQASKELQKIKETAETIVKQQYQEIDDRHTKRFLGTRWETDRQAIIDDLKNVIYAKNFLEGVEKAKTSQREQELEEQVKHYKKLSESYQNIASRIASHVPKLFDFVQECAEIGIKNMQKMLDMFFDSAIVKRHLYSYQGQEGQWKKRVNDVVDVRASKDGEVLLSNEKHKDLTIKEWHTARREEELEKAQKWEQELNKSRGFRR